MSKILLSSQENYIESFKRNVDPLINEIENYANENSIPILSWDAAELLEQYIILTKPKRVLEIGTAIGYSTIRIARLLKKKSEIDTIEKSEDNIALAENYFEKAKLNKKINLLKGDALDIMPTLKNKYEFIFLDADKEDYDKLFYYSLMLLRKGGLMFVDNLLWHGYAASAKVPAKYRESTKHIREFNKLFMSQNTLIPVILPVGDGVGVGVKVE